MADTVMKNHEVLGRKKFGQGIKEMSGNFKVGQSKIKRERLYNSKKYIYIYFYKKLLCIEEIFHGLLELLDFRTTLHLRGEGFMSKLPCSFVAYRLELTTDPDKENMTYYHLWVNL